MGFTGKCINSTWRSTDLEVLAAISGFELQQVKAQKFVPNKKRDVGMVLSYTSFFFDEIVIVS